VAPVLGIRPGILRVGPPGDPTGEHFSWWVGVLRSGRSKIVWSCGHQHSDAAEAGGCSRDLVMALRAAAASSAFVRTVAGTLRAWDAWMSDVSPDGPEFDRLEDAMSRLAEAQRSVKEAS
jgi:hypothetical protein